ncbi:MAG: PocR ligand-binding domain-containing protein [Candidatus Bathyarchaeota archaeon]|nr:PocR ligand-binding domain-containing protein [Candidatus Bathyarchaeota archaeon]
MGSLPFGVQAFENLTDAVIIVDGEETVIYLNSSASKLYESPKEEALGRKLGDLFTHEWMSKTDEQTSVALLSKEGSWAGNVYHVKSNGQKFLAFQSLSTFRDSSGNKRGTIHVIRHANDSVSRNKCLDEQAQSIKKLDQVFSTDEGIEKQELANLIDAQALQSMMDDLYAVTKIGFAVLDLKGNVLASTGWQDICTKFHRVNPRTLWNCLESDLVLTKGVAAGEFKTYKCKNNMWDIVTPLIIGKKHVGNLFSGQFFFDDEKIDKEAFIQQAETYGFDKETYLCALDKVPRWNRAVVRNLMQFYVKLAEMISRLSYSNLRLTKSLTEQKLIERELRESHHDLNHAQSVAKTGSWRLNVLSNQLLWSDETYRMFGIPKGTPLNYETFLERVHPEDRQLVDSKWKAALRGERYDVEHRILVNGNVFWVHERAELEFDRDGSLIGGFGTVQDITEHKTDEQTLQRLNRALRAISNSNQALMRATDESAFLQQGCRIIVEDCGYALVWIGFALDDEAKSVMPMAYAGFDKGYIDSLNITWADTERGRGPTGRAIRTGKPQITNDIRSDPAFAPWRKQALERGYASTVVLPLMFEGKAFGALNVYSPETNVFSVDEVKLLSELASDLSHGIILLRTRAAKEIAESELRKTSEQCRLALEASNIGAWDYDLKTGEIFWDERTREMFGVSSGSTIMYQEAMEKIHPDDRQETLAVMSDAVAGRHDGKFYHEFRVIRQDGSIRWIASHGRVYFSGEGKERKPTRFIGVNMDITKQKEDENALSKAREEWERTFDSLPDLIAIVDYKHRILRINKAMADKLGVRPEQCFGNHCYLCVHKTNQPPESCPHEKTLQDGKTHTAEIFEKRLGGKVVVSTAPLKDEQGKIIGSIHVIRQPQESNKQQCA